MYNPRVTQTVVQLLESGCVAERRFQPYEAHVPFPLQVIEMHDHAVLCRQTQTIVLTSMVWWHV